MISPIFIAECDLPPISETEVLRYAGDHNPAKTTLDLLRNCIDECNNSFNSKVVYRIFKIEKSADALSIGSMKIHSKNLSCNLKDCAEVIVFAATVGLSIDRLISKYSRFSPARSLMLHSIGTERVEALCVSFCEKIATELKCSLTARFSPGYGDLPLNLQKDILHLLNANNTVGIGLNTSLLLSPSKSVTAFAGIKSQKERELCYSENF